MRITLSELRQHAKTAIVQRNIGAADEMAWACAWLEACGYPGIRLLREAFDDTRREAALVRDALGLDLENVSCVYLAPQIMAEVAANGRAFLRNVRHGLYLVPFAVRANIGIGCPVDPAFALGGVRSKNPYDEKLAAAEAHGLEIADEAWAALG